MLHVLADVQVAFHVVLDESARVDWNTCGESVNIRSVFLFFF